MDIAQQLRESCWCDGRGCELCRGADEIEQLRAERNAVLKIKAFCDAQMAADNFAFLSSKSAYRQGQDAAYGIVSIQIGAALSGKGEE